MTRLETTLAKYQTSYKIANLFVLKYGSKIPDGLGWLSINEEDTTFHVALNVRSDQDHDASLTIMGDVFGREDWQAKVAYNNRGYDWFKTEDSVKLTIYLAQKQNQPETFPVQPNQFPI